MKLSGQFISYFTNLKEVYGLLTPTSSHQYLVRQKVIVSILDG